MRKILSLPSLVEWDKYTIEHDGVDSLQLIDSASLAFTKALNIQKKNIHIFCGPGKNGADGLMIARILLEQGYNVTAYFFPSDDAVREFVIKQHELARDHASSIRKLSKDNPLENLNIQDDDIIIDAIFGIGINKPISGSYKDLIEYLNKIPNYKVSVDIPSGLHPDDINVSDVIFRSDHTISFETIKLCFLLPKNERFVRSFKVVNIGLNEYFINKEECIDQYLEVNDIPLIFKKYPKLKYSHKGMNGHGLLIAGSKGMYGSAILSAGGALCAGIGKLTCHIPYGAGNIMHIAHPEILIEFDNDPDHISSVDDLDKYSAIALGPSLGQCDDSKRVLSQVLDITSIPVVIDADALNIIANDNELKTKLKPNHILTPHPKEMERLIGEETIDILNKAKEFSQRFGCNILLKGAHSCLILPSGERYFNSTGSPSMAKAGMGDILTGIILGFLSQGFSIQDALIVSMYIHGLAGELSAIRYGIYSTQASEVLSMFPEALSMSILN